MKKIIYIFAIMLFALVSCDKEEVKVDELNEINYTIEKEYLKFKSINDYVKLHDKLYLLSSEELEEWRNELPFKTLESYYQENNIQRYNFVQISDDEIKENFNTSRINPVLASMFSESGVLIINDTIMKIKNDELIIVKGVDFAQIAQIDIDNNYTAANVEKQKHTVLIEHVSFDDQEVGMMKGRIDDRSTMYYTGEKTRQYVNFDSYSQGAFVHFEMSGRHQRKSWFGWTLLPTDHPIVSGTINVKGTDVLKLNNDYNQSTQLSNNELISHKVFVGLDGLFTKFDVSYSFQKTTAEAYTGNWKGNRTNTSGSFFRTYHRFNY